MSDVQVVGHPTPTWWSPRLGMRHPASPCDLAFWDGPIERATHSSCRWRTTRSPCGCRCSRAVVRHRPAPPLPPDRARTRNTHAADFATQLLTSARSRVTVCATRRGDGTWGSTWGHRTLLRLSAAQHHPARPAPLAATPVRLPATTAHGGKRGGGQLAQHHGTHPKRNWSGPVPDPEDGSSPGVPNPGTRHGRRHRLGRHAAAVAPRRGDGATAVHPPTLRDLCRAPGAAPPGSRCGDARSCRCPVMPMRAGLVEGVVPSPAGQRRLPTLRRGQQAS